jgi:hypothetical protein
MLPKYVQTGNQQWGITKKRGANPIHIANKLVELLGGYAENINDEFFYIQLRTFVQKVNIKSGTIKWAPQNVHYHRDDNIDSTIYSYINACAYMHRPPENKKVEKKIKQYKSRFKMTKDYHIIIEKKKTFR